MIKTIDELKELIQWCKKEKVRALSVHGIQFELSDLALISDIMESPDMTAPTSKPEKTKEISNLSSDTLTDSLEPQTKEEEEALLFHSSQ